MYASISWFVSLIGYLTIANYLYEHLGTPCWLLWCYLKGLLQKRPSLRERFGSWAALTGSSDGIGKAYAIELAKQGLNVVLIARNEEKMRAVAAEIEQEHKVEVKIIVADFTQGKQVYEHIERELDQLSIGIFVNNVGMGVETPGPLWKSSAAEVQRIIDTNVVAVSQLSRYMFKRMSSSKIKGAIVNVSSASQTQPLPYGSLYAASKIYTRYLTLALQYEAQGSGILVQLLSPDFVMTKINNYSKRVMKGGLFIPGADLYARRAVSQLWYEVTETPGYCWHHLQDAALNLVPQRMRMIIVQTFFKLISDKKLY